MLLTLGSVPPIFPDLCGVNLTALWPSTCAAALVDAAGVASNFERMVRIADATGIPLDARMAALSQDVRDTLHLERFLAGQARL